MKNIFALLFLLTSLNCYTKQADKFILGKTETGRI